MPSRPRKVRLPAVADAGPLIHLEEVGQERTLGVFSSILVPGPVADEVLAKPGAHGSRALSLPPMKRVALRASEKAMAEDHSLRFDLALIDAAVLAVATQRRAPLLLTDDLDLRDAARSVGVRPVGSIGIVLRAARGGLLDADDAEKALDGFLGRSSLFITPSLIDEAKRALRARGPG